MSIGSLKFLYFPSFLHYCSGTRQVTQLWSARIAVCFSAISLLLHGPVVWRRVRELLRLPWIEQHIALSSERKAQINKRRHFIGDSFQFFFSGSKNATGTPRPGQPTISALWNCAFQLSRYSILSYFCSNFTTAAQSQ